MSHITIDTKIMEVPDSHYLFGLRKTDQSELTSGNFFFRDAVGRMHPLRAVECPVTTSKGFTVSLGHASGVTAKLIVETMKDNHHVIQVSVSGPCTWTGMDAKAYKDDHFLGFGERFNEIDQREKEVDLWVTNGANGGDTYKPIPFFMTPRGYGMAIETSHRILCRMATVDNPGNLSIQANANTLVIHFFTSADLKDILSLYTRFIGRSVPPKPWVYGPWKSRDWSIENQSTVMLDIYKQRELKLAATVKLIDASWQNEYNDFSFHKERFPEPAKMFQEAKAKGYKIILWISPFMQEGTKAFAVAREKGFLAHDSSGGPKLTRLGNDPDFQGAVFDFTNPTAVEWWKGRLVALMEMGASGFKTDFGEQVDEDALFFDGRTGKEIHNVFPVLYNKAAWEVVEPYGGILLGRSAWAGSQQFHGIWAGDQTSDFCRWSGLPSVVSAGISAGLSGFFLWGSDIGGYFSGPEKQVFIRWIQFGTFSPIMQIHGMGEHDPWNFDKETLRIYQSYADLRMRLLPYILGCANEYWNSGLPMMRGLALNYASDDQVFNNVSAHYEYLFGPNILAAPICFNGKGRSVYLPDGEWIDWWTGKSYAGRNKFWYDCGLDVMPLFIRSGSIIPLYASGIPTTLENEGHTPDYEGKITFECYPSPKDPAFFLVAGIFLAQLSVLKEDKSITFHVDLSKYKPTCRIVFMGFKSGKCTKIVGARISGNGTMHSAVADFSASEGNKSQGWYIEIYVVDSSKESVQIECMLEGDA